MIEEKNNLTNTKFLLYRTEDGKIHVETRMEHETVWLNQAQMCELFEKNKRTISEHIRNIFSEGELQEGQVVRKFRTTAADGKEYLAKKGARCSGSRKIGKKNILIPQHFPS